MKLPANVTESVQDKRGDFAVRHNVSLVWVPKCPERWSTASVYALLERLLNLDEVLLLDSQTGRPNVCRWGCSTRTKQCIKVNLVLLFILSNLQMWTR